jgi:hypothetical protein
VLVELSRAICSVNGVDECDITVTEVDAKTETIKLTVRGPDIDYNEIVKIMQKHAVSFRGVDEISVAKTKQASLQKPSGQQPRTNP